MARALTLVAVTGYGQDEDRTLAINAGFDEHMTKPVDPDILAQFVTAAPTRRRARTSAL